MIGKTHLRLRSSHRSRRLKSEKVNNISFVSDPKNDHINQPFPLAQCDQIGRFIAFWAIFQSQWQKPVAAIILAKLPMF